MGVTLHVHRLDNGQTIIDADDVVRFFAALSGEVRFTPEEADALARALRGDF